MASPRYQKIANTIWNRREISSLSPAARDLYFYLHTGLMNNICGCYVFKVGYAMQDMGLSSDTEVWENMNALIAADMVAFDADDRVLLLIDHFKQNPIKSQDQGKGVEKVIESLPFSRAIFDRLMKILLVHPKSTEDGACQRV